MIQSFCCGFCSTLGLLKMVGPFIAPEYNRYCSTAEVASTLDENQKIHKSLGHHPVTLASFLQLISVCNIL